MGKHVNHTKEEFAEAVSRSASVSEVLRRLGKKPGGGSHRHIRQKIEQAGINTSHFKGQAWREGHKGSPNKKIWQQILCKESRKRRQASWVLRRALIEMGRSYCCVLCGNSGRWKRKPLCLHVDHINKDRFDNRPENLRFVCPNCHTQLPTWGNNKGKTQLTTRSHTPWKDRSERTKKCSCGNTILMKSSSCRSCAGRRRKAKTKIDWPKLEELQKMVGRSSNAKVAQSLGVSETAVRKRLKRQ